MSNSVTKTTRIAIVGLGAVGTATAIHLLQQLRDRKPAQAIQVHTFEKAGNIGAGLAYSTRHDFHVLNMRARTMSLFREAPADFSDWLQTRNGYHPDDYVPRRLFGDYLKQRFREALQATAGTHIGVVQHHSEVTDGQDLGDRVVLTSGRAPLEFDFVIMCPGHLPAATEDGSYQQSPRYLASPWEERAYQQIDGDATVGVLGTSLTAVDVLLTLENRGFRGQILCFSRKRCLPKVAGPHVRYPLRHITHQRLRQLTDDFTRELTLREVQSLFAREMEETDGQPWSGRLRPGGESVASTLEHDLREAESGRTLWHSALDATSTLVPLIWRHMSKQAKAHFLAQHESTWTTFRHCMPAGNARQLLAMARANRLAVHTGLQRIKYDGRRGEFELGFRQQRKLCNRRVDYLINATGTSLSLDRIDSPLLENMRQRGQLLAHPLGGVDVEFSSGQLLYRHGVKSRRICFVGPLTKGVHFYTNSFEMNRDSAERATGFLVGSLLRRETPRSLTTVGWARS